MALPSSHLVRPWGYSGAVLMSRLAVPWALYKAEDFPPYSMVAIYETGHVRGCGVLLPVRTPEGDVRIWGESSIVVVGKTTTLIPLPPSDRSNGYRFGGGEPPVRVMMGRNVVRDFDSFKKNDTVADAFIKGLQEDIVFTSGKSGRDSTTAHER